MDPDFWHARWEANQIGFHQDQINVYLENHWSILDLDPGSRVLVPLCGKSLDLLWLREQGHTVIGIELSHIAVQAFFEENGINPVVQEETHCTRWSYDGIELLRGDFYNCEAADLGKVDALYDRAALIALTAGQRQRYAQRLAQLLKPGTPGLLVTLEYDQDEMDGPPFAVSSDEVRRLYDQTYRIEQLAQYDALEANPQFRAMGLCRLRVQLYRIYRMNTSG